MNIHKTPLAFFAYNRPEHTSRALNALVRCHRKEDFEFYFFSDAPRDSEARENVDKVRQILKENAKRFSAEVVERESNLGLARSIVDGVSRLCESHGRVAVLEDDLIVATDFLHFMASALDHYEDHPEVMQVGGYTIAPPSNCATDAFLLPVTTTWGWGTWARAWKQFSWEPKGWPAACDDVQWLSRFELNGAARSVCMLERRLAGSNDSWGILWWYAVSRLGGEVIYPANSLVSNDGFDGSGIHCGKSYTVDTTRLPKPEASLPKVVSFPRDLQHESVNLELFESVVLRRNNGLRLRVISKIRFFSELLRKGVRNAFR